MQAPGGTPIAQAVRWRAAAFALIVIALDQITKALVASSLNVGETRPVIGDILRLTHIRNPGAAFGMLRGLGGMLALAALVGIVVFAAVIVRQPPPMTAYGAALVAAGATGNLIDRLLRDGGVIDFVDFRYWPAFNVADSAISVGAILLLWAGFRSEEKQVEQPAHGS